MMQANCLAQSRKASKTYRSLSCGPSPQHVVKFGFRISSSAVTIHALEYVADGGTSGLSYNE